MTVIEWMFRFVFTFAGRLLILRNVSAVKNLIEMKKKKRGTIKKHD